MHWLHTGKHTCTHKTHTHTHHGATVAVTGVHQLSSGLKDGGHGLLLSLLHTSAIHGLHAHGRVVTLVSGTGSEDS